MKKQTKNTLKITGKIKATLRDAKTGKIKQIVENHNIIATVGHTAIARRLINSASVANEGIITYGAVGDGTDTPAIGDTVMENEIDRNTIATSSVTGATLTIETYFTTSEAIGSLTKFALFGEDASASADSGTLFQHADFNATIEKTSNDTLTVESQISIT